MNPVENFRATLWAALALLALSPPAVNAQQIDYGRSQVTVVSRQMNVPVEAKFQKFNAQLSFDPAKPEASRARIEVEIASFDIGNDDVNGEVLKKGWFDAKDFPKALFVSSSVRALGNDRYEARGALTIKGKTRQVSAPFTVKNDNSGNMVFDGAFAIRRLDYDIGEGVWNDTDTVADEVQIKFRLYTGGKFSPRKSGAEVFRRHFA